MENGVKMKDILCIRIFFKKKKEMSDKIHVCLFVTADTKGDSHTYLALFNGGQKKRRYRKGPKIAHLYDIPTFPSQASSDFPWKKVTIDGS